MARQLNIISLGAGVQSSTMALMAAKDELEPKIDCGIFADTGWEPKAVYDWLSFLEKELPFPIHRVSAGNLRTKILSDGYSDVPWHTNGGMGRRQCTKVFKLYPIRDQVKKLLGVSHGRELSPSSIIMWVGISKDEAFRMKPSTVKYIENRWPLVEKGFRRHDCLMWMEDHGYPQPPRSACIGCPYKSDAEWRDTKMDAVMWKEAVKVDKAIRNLGAGNEQQFMHRTCQPLEQIDFRNLEDLGQINMFDNECEGMCGV